MEHEMRDITIIGGGPAGLFALFYAGMRGATAQIVDALPELGGQLAALYPEKYIFDVAGYPKVLAKDLVKALREQAAQFKQPTHLGQRVTGLAGRSRRRRIRASRGAIAGSRRRRCGWSTSTSVVGRPVHLGAGAGPGGRMISSELNSETVSP
jgi:NADPH-dependent 2,4-dienoyl-CoA reductase/sulfur reductase-like enzyme